MPSLITRQMSEDSEITVIPRDNSTPWSSVDLRGANNGAYDELPSENGCSSSEGQMSVSTPAINNSDASTDVTSNTNAEHGSVCGQQLKARSLEVPAAVTDLPWPVPDDKPLYNDHELKIEDECEAENLSLITGPGDSTRAGFSTQASSSVRSLVGSGRACVKYKCVTQLHGCNELRIGQGRQIPRWNKGSEIPYIVCTESFKPPEAAALVGDAMKEAISMWGRNIGVSFKQVFRCDPATFQIKYQKFPDNNNPNVYAQSFFPRKWASSLFVYQRALDNADFLANILAHEFGHILGLRHEFAAETERYMPSVCFENENGQSVMNYFDHLSQHQVGKQDVEEVAAFYAYDQDDYQGLPVVGIAPCLHIFGDCSGGSPQETFALCHYC